jgi:hypothetical protein
MSDCPGFFFDQHFDNLIILQPANPFTDPV